MKKNILLILPIALLFVFSCKENTKTQNQTPVADKELQEIKQDVTFNEVKPVFEILEKDPNYNNLLKLLNQAQLIDAVKGLDDITFFAPTNAAINRLEEDVKTSLTKPQNLDKLQNILKYHIVKGEFDAATIISTIKISNKPYRLETLSGSFISINLSEKKVVITDENGNSSEVSSTDIEASNGVIHGIENILIPVN